ncbi:MAG TPA: RbsD/FucU family protein [Phototrophicaceae bacterium]|nr:RbsD/FucU family protein [Phototrophicaceae bacterium]
MLKSQLLHPEILHTLGQSGHGSKVLIADGNYPFKTGSNPAAEHVFLNLRPGLISVTDILETLVTAIPVEAAYVMQPADGSEPPIFAEFRRILPELQLQKLERFTFYDTSRERDVALVIASGDQRLYANILLTIGVVPPT